jgi:hypothetical protein
MVVEKIKNAILPTLSEMNLSIYKIVYEKENGKNYLRVFLEKEDYSLDLDTCVVASETISKGFPIIFLGPHFCNSVELSLVLEHRIHLVHISLTSN